MNFNLIKQAAVLAALVSLGSTAWAQGTIERKAEPKTERKGFSAGFDISDSANARQIGLPLYPGATVRRDSEKESESLRPRIWRYGPAVSAPSWG